MRGGWWSIGGSLVGCLGVLLGESLGWGFGHVHMIGLFRCWGALTRALL